MQIHSRTVYSIGATDFANESAARQWIADKIGRTIDKALSDAGHVLGPRHAIAVNDAMLKNSATLAALLSAYSAPVSDS